MHKLMVMAKDRGITCPALIGEAGLFKLLGIDRPPVVDLRAIRCESLRGRGQSQSCEIVLIPVPGGHRRHFRSIALAAKAVRIDRTTLARMRDMGYTFKGWRVGQPEDQ